MGTKTFEQLTEDFLGLLGVVLRRNLRVGPATTGQLEHSARTRAAIAFDRGEDLNITEIASIIDEMVQHVLAPVAPSQPGISVLPGADIRRQILPDLKATIPKSKLAELKTESDRRIAELCFKYCVSEEQLFRGLTHLDNAEPMNWRIQRSQGRRTNHSWTVDKAVFRHYLSGTAVDKIPTKIREEFALLSKTTVQIPDVRDSVENAMMTIRAIPTLVLLAMAVFILASGTAVAKAFGFRIARDLSWSMIGSAAYVSGVVLVSALTLLLAIGALGFALMRSCEADPVPVVVIRHEELQNSRYAARKRPPLVDYVPAHGDSYAASTTLDAATTTRVDVTPSTPIPPVLPPALAEIDAVEDVELRQFYLDEFKIWMYRDIPVSEELLSLLGTFRGEVYGCISGKALPPGQVVLAFILDGERLMEAAIDELPTWPPEVGKCIVKSFENARANFVAAAGTRTFVLEIFAGLSEPQVHAAMQHWKGWTKPAAIAPLPR